MSNLLDYETVCKLRYLVNKGNGVNAIASRLGLTEDDVTHFLFDNDYTIENGSIVKENKRKQLIKELKISKDIINILILADTHLGSVHDNVDLLKRVYNEALDRETDYIFHLGDLSNGINKDSRFKSFDSLKNYCIRHYPYSEVETFILSGNHDRFDNCRKNLVQELTKERTDLNYLGDDPVVVKVNDTKFLLAHGDDKKKKYVKMVKNNDADVLMYGHEHHYGLVNQKGYKELKVPSLLDDGVKEMGVWWLSLFNNNETYYELETFPKRVLKK